MSEATPGAAGAVIPQLDSDTAGEAADDRGLCIAVLTGGWVYVGRCRVAGGWLHIPGARRVRRCRVAGGCLHISGARCVRRWGSSAGLNQIAELGPTPKTILDHPADISVPVASSLIHLIRCNPEAWQ